MYPVPLTGTHASTLLWADPSELDEAVIQQLQNIANLPWTHGLRVMPDVHLGQGATIGSVIAMRDALSPAAVGVDIGCGMAAVKTDLTAADLPDDLARLRHRIESAIPVGFQSHTNPVNITRLRLPDEPFALLWGEFTSLDSGIHGLFSRAQNQIGTLGGGNHFIELCLDETDSVWLMLHSGSRNIGKELADRHITKAKSLSHNQNLPDQNLSVFLAGTPEMAAYRSDLMWAQRYAALNRRVMLALFQGCVLDEFDGRVTFAAPISCHHNYVAEETIDGEQMLVTRKGAIRAGLGELGLIPGSMATGSYVVRGLGNPASFQSASHGAGRKMSRSAARRTFSVADLVEQTAGVESRKDSGIIDEIPGAYKDLETVINAQLDLITVEHRLRTILCVKG